MWCFCCDECADAVAQQLSSTMKTTAAANRSLAIVVLATALLPSADQDKKLLPGCFSARNDLKVQLLQQHTQQCTA